MTDSYTQDFIDEVKGALNSGSSGGGTIDQTARDDISRHASDSEIHVTTVEKASWNGKAELTDIPTTLPANGGNADTVDGLHASDIQIDSVSDTAGIVTLDGLQGEVPFSEIVLNGDIIGQEITLTACGKNLIPYPYSRTSGIYNGITIDISNDGKFSASGVATAGFTLITFANQDKPIKLVAGRTYTISCSKPYDINNFNLYFRIYHTDGTYSGVTSYPTTFIAKDGDYITGSLCVDKGTSFNVSNVSIQIELGDTATEYEPYSGTTTRITPDINPYNVQNDIRQQEGVNNVSVSAGEVSVTGVKKNTAIKKIWDNKADLSDIPTTLPANGGNADTLDGKHASDFMPYIGAVTDLFTVNKTCICKYTSTTLNTPYKANLTTSATGLCIVNYEAGINHVVYFVSPAGSTNFYTAVTANGEIVANKGWRKVADGGNAASVGAYTEAKIAALEARIAALEAKG